MTRVTQGTYLFAVVCANDLHTRTDKHTHTHRLPRRNRVGQLRVRNHETVVVDFFHRLVRRKEKKQEGNPRRAKPRRKIDSPCIL